MTTDLIYIGQNPRDYMATNHAEPLMSITLNHMYHAIKQYVRVNYNHASKT